MKKQALGITVVMVLAFSLIISLLALMSKASLLMSVGQTGFGNAAQPGRHGL